MTTATARAINVNPCRSSSPYVIERARVDCGRIPVDLTFSYGRVDTFSFTIVRLWSRDHCGAGEVLVPYHVFVDQLLGDIVGADVRRLDAMLPADLFLSSSPHGDYHRILCEAVSIAMYDLLGQIADMPLYALLGGAKQLRIPLMPCLFPHNADEARHGAHDLYKQGYRFFKVKLVGDLAEDRARVEAIRSVVPRHCTLQGDGNCGYKTLNDAQHALAVLGEAGLDIFEDPLKGSVDDYIALTRGRANTHAKVMIDALARRTEDLVSALRSGACDMVNIHPDQPGSISRVLQHASLASAFGVSVTIGGTGYTGIGSAAYQHIAGVIGGPVGELGGYFDHGMPCSLVKKPLKMHGGSVELPDTPGLGVELNIEALDEFVEDSKEYS